QKTVLRLLPDRDKLPETSLNVKSRICRKRSFGNLTALLYGCLLSVKKIITVWEIHPGDRCRIVLS
ncbi:hypothetical protein, partial [Escherichia coli]|uniref:hypothetical protein n=1 Tax=Escherichia coli TaxID=562 RepID=UPI001BDD49CF